MGIVHDLVIQPQTRPLSGSVPVPPDPHIAELALLTAALSEGTCELRKLGKTERIAGAMRALAQLGVTIEHEGGDLARVHGASLLGLKVPNAPLLMGSPSTLRLLAGILVAYPFQTVLVGEGALASDHLASLVSPLRRRGAQIEGAFSKARVGEVIPPLTVGPLAPLQRLAELDHQFEVASPYVKDALIFSGLYADGPTYVRERLVSRDHLERLIQALEVPLATAGPILELDVERWEGKLPAFSCEVPGDFSAALVLLAAATLVPGSRVCARNTGLNLTRTGGLDLLRKWEPRSMSRCTRIASANQRAPLALRTPSSRRRRWPARCSRGPSTTCPSWLCSRREREGVPSSAASGSSPKGTTGCSSPSRPFCGHSGSTPPSSRGASSSKGARRARSDRLISTAPATRGWR